MNKREFLAELRGELAKLPKDDDDIDEQLSFYGEMIDDCMEEGLSESEAVAAVGSVQKIVEQSLTEIPMTRLVREKISPRRTMRVWEIVLLIAGSPIWASLLLAAIAIALAVYIVIGSAGLALYAVDLALTAGGVAGLIGAAAYAALTDLGGAAFFLGAGLTCCGIAVLLFFGANRIAKLILLLSGKMLVGIKKCLVRRGSVQ